MLLAFVLRIYECQMFYYAETVFTLSEFSEIYCIIMTMSKCFSRFRPRLTNVSFYEDFQHNRSFIIQRQPFRCLLCAGSGA